MKPVLSKRAGWVLLAVLVFIDAVLDVIRGVEGNPLWKLVIDMVGIKNMPFVVPFVLILFYFIVKVGGWLIKKVDKTPMAEELVLTTLVIVYGFFDIWVIAVDFLGFRFITNFRIMIIPLTGIALGYALWAEKGLKKK